MKIILISIGLFQTVVQKGFSQYVVNGDFEEYQTPADHGAFAYTVPYGNLFTNITGWKISPSIDEAFGGLLISGEFSTQSGSHAGFIEGTTNFCQHVTFIHPGKFRVKLGASGRSVPYGPNPIVVSIGGTPLTFGGVQTLTPTQINPSWGNYESDYFTITVPGVYALTIAGTQPLTEVDHMTFVDNVGVEAEPLIANGTFDDYAAPGGLGGLRYTWPQGTLPTLVPGWTMAASQGDQFNGLFRLGDFSPQSGEQSAFIEGTGSLSRVINFTVPGQYVIGIGASGRQAPYGPNPLSIRLNGDAVPFGGLSTLTPLQNNPSWGNYTSGLVEIAEPGAYELTISGTHSLSQADHMSFIDNVTVSPFPAISYGTSLNNLVTEFVNSDLSVNRRFVFVTPREGWVYVRLRATLSGSGYATAVINDDPSLTLNVSSSNMALPEAMWYLPAGTHAIRVLSSGSAQLNNLVVRSIPELMYFQLYNDSGVFHRTYSDLRSNGVLENFNTIVSWLYPAPQTPSINEVADWRSLGRKWMNLGSLPVPFGSDQASVDAGVDAHWIGAMLDEQVDGAYIDEFVSSIPEQAAVFPLWANSIQRFPSIPEIQGKQFYAFIGGGQSFSSYNTLFRAIYGAGYRIAPECYPKNTLELSQTMAFLGSWIVGLPNLQHNMVYITGPSNAIPALSFHVDPQLNFKALLDEEFRQIANNQGLGGLFGIGMYESRLMDEDIMRWYARLLRHYCIEGATTLLSNDPIVLNQIQNPGFENGLTSWLVSPASTHPPSIASYSVASIPIRRISSNFAVPEGAKGLWTQRKANSPNIVSQTISNLVVGRTYHVNIYAVDRANYLTHAPIIGFVSVSGANVIGAESSDVAIMAPALASDGISPISVCWTKFYRIFEATSTTATLTISDWQSPTTPGGAIGQEVVWDFIDVAPDVSMQPVH